MFGRTEDRLATSEHAPLIRCPEPVRLWTDL